MRKHLIVFTLAIWSFPAYSSVTTYTSSAQWLQATGSGANVLLETFAGPGLTIPGLSVASVSGASNSGLKPGDGHIANGKWNDCVGNCGFFDFDSTTWSLNRPMYAFGATFDIGINGIQLSTNNFSFAVPSSQNLGNPTDYVGFFGWVSTTPFTSVSVNPAYLIPHTPGTSYTMADLEISTATPTPEPSTFWLALALVPVIGWYRIRRALRNF